MKSKLLKLFLGVFAVSMIFTGCSSKTNDTATPKAEDSAKSEVVEIDFFHRWPQETKNDYFEEKVKEFEASHPNVKINTERVSNDSYKEKIKVLVANNNMPDIFVSWSDSFALNLVSSGKIMPLDDIYADDAEWASKIIPSAIEGFTFDGVKYGVPLTIDGKAFFYNKDIFAELGLDVPKTYTELIETFKALQAAGYETPLVDGLSEPWVVSHFEGPIFARVIDPEVLAKDYDQNTGEFTDPGYIEGLNMFKEITSYMGEISLAIDHETARNMFVNGEAPMTFCQLAEIGMIETANPNFNFGYFDFPAVEGGKGDQKAMEGAPEGFMLSKDAPPEAVEFLKFLTSEQAAYDWTKANGELTAIEGGVTDENASEKIKEAYELVLNAESITPWFDNAVNINIGDVFMKGGQSLAIGETTPEKIMEEVQAEAAKLRK